MSTVDQLVYEINALPQHERVELLARVISAQPENVSALAPEWQQELDRRIQELSDGTAVTTPWEEVRERIHRKYLPNA